MKKRTFRICFVFMIILIFMIILKVNSGLAEGEVTTYDVSNVKEWVEAIKSINSNGSGNFIVNLKGDISKEQIEGKTYFPNVSIIVPANVTIIGNGHTISFPAGGGTGSGITVEKGAILNLGKEDGSDTLILAGSVEGNDDGGLIYIYEPYIKESMATGGTCNMYKGVTLKDRITSNYYGSGVSVSGIKTVFNMYGGTIQNCGFSSVSSGSVVYGGGVSVKGGTFNMYDGTIKDCHALSTAEEFYGHGGGICLVLNTNSQSRLNITGGTIENCRADVGGGIYAEYNYYPDRSSVTNIQNCKIINNHATYDGGGIYSAACRINITGSEITGNSAEYGGGMLLNGSNSWPTTVNMDDTCKLCNNTATGGGSDVDAYKSTITLPVASSMNEKYLASEPSYASQKKINGWYEDKENDDSTGTKRYKNQTIEEAVLVNETSIDAMTEEQLLIAGNNGEDDTPGEDPVDPDNPDEPDEPDEPVDPSNPDDEKDKDPEIPSQDDKEESKGTNEVIPEKNEDENENAINNEVPNKEIENNTNNSENNKSSDNPDTGDKIKKYFVYLILASIFLTLIIINKSQNSKGKH